MTAMPPEPDFRNLPPPPAYPPPVYPPPDQYAPRRRPRAFSVVRIACGVLWAAFTVILAAGTVMEWLTGLHAASIMCLVFAVGCGWYDYRIWTFKARRLWFLSEGAPTRRPILALLPRHRDDCNRYSGPSSRSVGAGGRRRTAAFCHFRPACLPVTIRYRLRAPSQRRRCHNHAHRTTSLSQRRRCASGPRSQLAAVRGIR
jgi:hypothetical protein